jgi:hypothetical protein
MSKNKKKIVWNSLEKIVRNLDSTMKLTGIALDKLKKHIEQ